MNDYIEKAILLRTKYQSEKLTKDSFILHTECKIKYLSQIIATIFDNNDCIPTNFQIKHVSAKSWDPRDATNLLDEIISEFLQSLSLDFELEIAPTWKSHMYLHEIVSYDVRIKFNE